MTQRPFGNPIKKAWVAGWDAGVVGRSPQANPYQRRPQKKAWERGREAALRSGDNDVAALNRMLSK